MPYPHRSRTGSPSPDTSYLTDTPFTSANTGTPSARRPIKHAVRLPTGNQGFAIGARSELTWIPHMTMSSVLTMR